MNALTDILGSRVKAELFRLLFGLTEQELHVRELARRAGLNDATVRQELVRLVRVGLVVGRKDGNRTCYRADTSHPLYQEVHRLVLKTSGLADVLRKALAPAKLDAAFVFGSMAAETGKAHSDVDLMVIGHMGLRSLTQLLPEAAQELSREINPHVLTPGEFAKRRATGDHFLTTVLAAPRIFIVGDEHELAAMGH